MQTERFDTRDFELSADGVDGDPFAVPLAADFRHESGERIGGVPGFYAGDGEWVIRFSPTRTGTWRGTTASEEAALDGRELGPVECVASTNPDVHGRIRVDSENSRRFRFEDGSEYVPLGFEFDWLFAYHQAEPQECRQTLEILADRGFNHIVMNLYAHTGFSDPERPDVYGPPDVYPFGGTNDDPDHEVLNPAFFDDLDGVFEHLHDLGLVSHLLIQVQNKGVNWPERNSPADDRFWRYVVARYAAYPNLLWDLSKESYNLRRETGSHAYARDRIAFVREADPYDHLVTAHDSDRGRSPRRLSVDQSGEDHVDEAVDFVSDQIALDEAALAPPETADRYVREATLRYRDLDRPYLNAENGAEEGVESLQTFTREASTGPWEDVLLFTWAIYAGGGYSCYYYSNTAWDLIRPEPEPPGWERYADLRATLEAFDLNRMAPAHELASRGYCLAEPGRQYLLFLPEGGDVEVDLSHVSGGGDSDLDLGGSFDSLACEALDVLTGERAAATPRDDGNGFWHFATDVENPLPTPTHPFAITIRGE
jgi:hypothetical protein